MVWGGAAHSNAVSSFIRIVGCEDFSRHGGAATALQKGIGLATAQKVLGHDWPQATAIYLNFTDSADLVRLRNFGCLSIAEAAQVLGISPRTADRRWARARAWLRREIEGDGADHEVREKSWRDWGREIALSSG
jgi:hypothetical protein